MADAATRDVVLMENDLRQAAVPVQLAAGANRKAVTGAKVQVTAARKTVAKKAAGRRAAAKQPATNKRRSAKLTRRP